MCDTFAFVPGESGSPVLFGKNSDREPNEAQQIVRIAAHTRDSDIVRATYIDAEAPREVHEVILSKPFQMWGAEMGVNEFGVAIGNEAVFTRVNFVKKLARANMGLTGMDMVRLALESAKTALEARDRIIYLLERYGQNACGGYTDRKFYYHNSFMIADPFAAFVLETAGPFWAYKRVIGYRAISNGLTLGCDYDEVSKGAFDFARRKGWSDTAGAFDFHKSFSAFWMPRLSACDTRRSISEKRGGAAGIPGVADGFEILRAHVAQDFRPSQARPDSICMHASGLFCPHQTTGSMVAELRPGGRSTVWLTGSAAPCLSLFKPFYFGCDVLDQGNFPSPGARPADYGGYWWDFERFHRQALFHYDSIISQVRSDQAHLESEWIRKDTEMEGASKSERNKFSGDCLRDSLAARERWMSSLHARRRGGTGTSSGIFHSYFWKRRNREAGLK